MTAAVRFEAPALPPLAAFRDRAEEAGERAQQRREAGYADGYAAGYEMGLAQAARDGEAEALEHRRAATRLGQAADALQRAAADLAARDAAALAAIESDVLQLAFGLAEAIVGHELRATDTPVLDALARAARLLPDRGDSVVRVHPDDLAVAAAAVSAEPAGWPGDVQVVGDRNVEPGGCVVDVGECRIDAQVGAAIERLRAAWA